ncbi:MAG TPA: hypothetical protein VMN99_03975, partial [Anaerolineales bacterium]|nr:hypothetical protein [Anaerolineales bacterium]
MKNTNGAMPFSQYELRQFIYPLTLTALAILALMFIEGLTVESPPNYVLMVYSAAGLLHVIVFDRLISSSTKYPMFSTWINPITSGIGLGLLPYLLPGRLIEIFHILSILGITGVVITAGRRSAYVNLAIILLISLWFYVPNLHEISELFEFFTPFLISTLIIEAVARIEGTTRQHIHQLETINKVSRQIMMSLDTGQTISLLNATIQDALEADTYYVGIVKNGEVHLDLFY